jgi:hypothetical protein
MYILPYYILIYPIIDLQRDLIEIKFGVKALLWYSKIIQSEHIIMHLLQVYNVHIHMSYSRCGLIFLKLTSMVFLLVLEKQPIRTLVCIQYIKHSDWMIL